MTFAEFRRFGYVSKLRHLVCKGPSQSLVDTTTANAGSQAGIANTESQIAQQNQAQALQLEQPLINKEQALATGDRQSALAAAMPTISTISGGYDAAKQSILNSLPAGAARDKALATLETQKATGIAGAQASEVEQAPQILANVGQGIGAFSLQQLGAALSGYSGSTSSASSAANLQMQQSQAKWQPVTALAGAAGGAAGNIFFGKG